MNLSSDLERTEEALILLRDAIDQFSLQPHDIASILRKCQHICEILNWGKQRELFWNEFNGYQAGMVIPGYRIIRGVMKWEVIQTGRSFANALAEEIAYGKPDDLNNEESISMEISMSINQILQLKNTGYSIRLDNTTTIPSRTRHSNIIYTQIKTFHKAEFDNLLTRIESVVFDFISETYVQLKYSERIFNIWSDYQSLVDSTLAQSDFRDHLESINMNIGSTNPQDWRIAVFGCRNLLHDLADYLWKDIRDTYLPLQGLGRDGRLEVTADKFANRLIAFLHQKSILGTKGKFLREELEKISDSISALISYQSEAHEEIRKIDADSIVINTYILIGEIILRTDFIPIKEYI
jgi:hypothetical protein